MQNFYTEPELNLEGTIKTVRFLVSQKEDLFGDFKKSTKMVTLLDEYSRYVGDDYDEVFRLLEKWCNRKKPTPFMSGRQMSFFVSWLLRYFITYRDELLLR